MHSDDKELMKKQLERGRLGEDYARYLFPVLVKNNEENVKNYDLIDSRNNQPVEVKLDPLLLVTGNIMAELIVSDTEAGWIPHAMICLANGWTVPFLYIFINDSEDDGKVVGIKFIEYIRFIAGQLNIPYFKDAKPYLEFFKSEDFAARVKHLGWKMTKGVFGNSQGSVLLVPYKEMKEFGVVSFEYLPERRDKKTFKQFIEKDEVVEIRVEEPQDVKEESKPIESEEVVERDNFVHLHVHSQYSLLDGVPTPEDIVKKVKDNGQHAVALTDHGYMFGLYKFQQACNDYGIKPIHGFEAYIAEDMHSKESRQTYHLILLAMNDVGWQNLIQLNTIAGKEGFYYRPRLDFAMLSKYTEGIICLSACYKSPVSYHFSVDGRNPDLARDNMRILKGMFGDRFYNEIQQTGWSEYDDLVPEVIQLAEEEGVKTVITNDAHYAEEMDFEVQKTLTNITTGGGIDFEGKGFYLKKREQMITGPVTPAMADLTMEIADRVKFELNFSGYLFPAFDITQTDDYKEFVQDRS